MYHEGMEMKNNKHVVSVGKRENSGFPHTNMKQGDAFAPVSYCCYVLDIEEIFTHVCFILNLIYDHILGTALHRCSRVQYLENNKTSTDSW